MSTSTITQTRSGDPTILPAKWVRVLRAAVLIVIGLAVTFTATFHEQFTFDVGVISAGLVLIGICHLLEWVQRRGRGGAPVALLLGLVAVSAGVLVLFLQSELALPLIVASWALVSALLEFLGVAIVPGSRQDAPVIGAAGVILAITTLLARGDMVAVIGFFGGYAVIAGVFLGIAAFDSRRSEGDTADSLAPEEM